ncbi:MAG: GIY-YIG nuclease family protein [Dehalococcoidia bacterium]
MTWTTAKVGPGLNHDQKSGIYTIKNITNNKIYIGSAINVEKRLLEHKYALKRGDHINNHLQQAWNKYGESSFVFEKYLSCTKQDLLFFEQLVIDSSITRYGSENLYNFCLTAGSTLGRYHSSETKIKIGLKSKGRWTGKHHTEETKEKIRLGNIGVNKGKHHTLEAKIKMSEYRKGKKFTEEHKKNLAKSIKESWIIRKQNG